MGVFFGIKHYSFDNIPFSFEERKNFSLFIGDANYLRSRYLEFNYKFKKTIGFGLSSGTVTKYKFNIVKKSGVDKKNRDKIYFYIMIMYVNNKETCHYFKYYLCNNLNSCINKIKDIKKSV